MVWQEEHGMATHPRRSRATRARAMTPQQEETPPRKKAGRPKGLPGSFGAKTYVISSSLLDTSLRNLSSDMAEVVGIVAIIVGKTEGFA